MQDITDKKLPVVYILLTAVTFIVYRQVTGFDFINLDDPIYVIANSYLKSGFTLDSIRWAFSIKDVGWDPLTFISLMFDYRFYGLNAGGYHLTNLILHILSTLLLFWLFHRMTKEIWKSAFVAALFALHPLHVESVAWVSERKDVLSAFFWMLTLCLYVWYTEKPAIKRYLLVLFSFALALSSKPMAVTLPVVMILLDVWPLKRFALHRGSLISWQLKEKAFFLILSFIIVIITVFNPVKYAGPYRDVIPSGIRLLHAPVSFMTYPAKIFWPDNLSILYPFPGKLPFWQAGGALLLIVIITAAVIAGYRRKPYLLVGWLWYSIAILPVIGIIQVKNEAMADRYTYLPSIGIFVMLAWGMPLLIEQNKLRKMILWLSGTAVLAVLAVLTWTQCGYWKNSVTLYNHALHVNGKNYRAGKYLGIYLYDAGNFRQAVNQFNNTLRIKPDDAEAYYFLGNLHYQLGEHQLSLDNYNKAILLKDDVALTYHNRGVTRYELRQYVPASEDFSKSLTLDPTLASAYAFRGSAYFKMGKKELVCPDYRKACLLGECKPLQWAKSQGLCNEPVD